LTDRAVVLARGLGTRMRRAERSSGLAPEQQQAADLGLKAMMPFGRPFLDHVLSGLADAGCSRACLVIGPEHDAVRAYYSGAGRPSRIAIEFAIQEQPLGTADAVLAAESFAAGQSVIVVNADNLYPRSALAALRALPRAGLVGFRRSTLIRNGNIPAERVLAFALIEVTPDGFLRRIVEKPEPAAAAGFGDDPEVSMNAWLLPPSIHSACRAIAPSPRGELELQDAVQYSVDRLGERFRVIPVEEGVLDLSSRADIPAVAERLRGLTPNP
jgi:dTDP-glucose pyrophosphorylase